MSYNHGYVNHGYHNYGKGAPSYTNSEVPWYITIDENIGANIRADGLTTETLPSPIRPGQTVEYSFVFLPQTGRGFTENEHIERYERARDLLIKADDVVVYGDVPGDTVRYREQHFEEDGAQLVRIGPLEETSDASAPAGEAPPGRDSIHDPRWAVVTGGEAQMTRPEKVGEVRLEAATIAPASEFSTRSAVRAAREVNGL